MPSLALAGNVLRTHTEFMLSVRIPPKVGAFCGDFFSIGVSFFFGIIIIIIIIIIFIDRILFLDYYY